MSLESLQIEGIIPHTHMDTMTQCAIWLIKNLCLDTNATTAKLEQDVTFEGNKLGRYKITIEKIEE